MPGRDKKRRQDERTPAKDEEISTAEKKAKNKRNKIADLGLSPETPVLRKKGTLYAQISTPSPYSDGLEDTTEQPLTKRVVRIENHMTKLDEMIEKKVDEEYVDSLVEKLDLLDDDV